MCCETVTNAWSVSEEKNMATQPHWFPILATPNILTIVEECDCVCSDEGLCCCYGEARTTDSSGVQNPDFKEFDGVDDILAVSHLSEKPSIKKRIPLLRAKTLPAIISPSLSIIQAPIAPEARSKIPTITTTVDSNGSSKISPGKSRAKRSPGSSSKKRDSGSEKWQLLVDDDVSSAKSPGNSPRNSFSSTGSVTSQASSSKDNRSEHGSQGSRAGLGKLARFLTARDKSVSGDRPSSHGSDSSLAPDTASLRKANSIDSLLETSISGYNLDTLVAATHNGGGLSPATPGSSGGKPLPVSPSVPAKLEKRSNSTATSPTTSKHSKGSRQGSLERIIDSSPLSKAERKKLEKYNKFNIELQALFAAVEHKQLDRARGILESTNVDVNSVNADGFTSLDLAVMTTNVAMVQLLQSHGAAESPRYSSSLYKLQLGVEREHACPICPFSTSDAHQMEKHRKSHSLSHQYSCQTCHKIFSTLTLLKRHKLIHTGERPYVCGVCKKAFNQKSTLQGHSYIHFRP